MKRGHRFYKALHQFFSWVLTFDWNYDEESTEGRAEKARDCKKFHGFLRDLEEDIERTL